MPLLSTRLDCLLYLSFLISTTLAQGQIAQYLDDLCSEKSAVNPTVSLPLDTCLVTSDVVEGIAVQILPTCLAGNVNATLQVYNDQSCAILSSTAYAKDDGCISSAIGLPSVMFTCGSAVDGDSVASSTTTVTAGSVLVPVAGATGITTDPTSSGLSSRTATDSNGLVASATPTSSATNPSQTNASGTDGSSSSGLSQNEQIILGIALSASAIAVALLAWLYPTAGSSGGDQQNNYGMLNYPVHHMSHWHRR